MDSIICNYYGDLMKLKLYYVVQLVNEKADLLYEAGPFKSWGECWNYIQVENSVEKDLYAVDTELEVQL